MKTLLPPVVLATILLCCCGSCALKRRPYTTDTDGSVRFTTLREAYSFCLYRHNFPTTLDAITSAAAQSTLAPVFLNEDDEFLVIRFDYRDTEHPYGIRGSNGPFYVLRCDGLGYRLVGGFQGSRVDVRKVGEEIVALLYYHSSARADPPAVHPLEQGVFNRIDLSVRGRDLFK